MFLGEVFRVVGWAWHSARGARAVERESSCAVQRRGMRFPDIKLEIGGEEGGGEGGGDKRRCRRAM
jgi:hypothetical protein